MSPIQPLPALLRAGLNLYNLARRPKTDGKLTIKGLPGEVEIIRDWWGVAHIYAQTLEAVLFGQGFTHAQERLWQMDFTRRLVSGRLAEVLGKPGLEADVVFRTLGLRRVAEESAARMDEQERARMSAFCAGVNTCIERQMLPVEFSLLGYRPEPWTAADSFSWVGLLFWQLGSFWESKVLRGELKTALGPERFAALELGDEYAWPLILDAALPGPYRPGRSYTGPTSADGAGSNNWAVSGSRSASGKPILADDMHLGLTAPAIFIQNHLCGGGLNAVGVSFPGLPFVIQGHNGKVAWAYTSGCADIQDLYEEHLRERSGVTEYEFRGEWLPAKTREERIRVKGQPDSLIQVTETCHGPVINHALLEKINPNLPPYAMQWTAFETTSAKLVQGMNFAEDCEAFHQALRCFAAPTHNMVYADTQGNIAYTLAGRVPIRAQGDPSAPMPGWTGEHEWLCMIPFEDMPHMVNPARGFIATANNRVVGPEYPYYLGKDFFIRDRVQRICEMLAERPAATLEGMQAMQMDVVSPTARLMKQAAFELSSDDAEIRQALDLLYQFDGAIRVDSPGAALYEVWVRQAIAVMLEGRLCGLEERVRGIRSSGMWSFHAMEWLAYHLEENDSPWWQGAYWKGRNEILLEALRRAVDDLKQRLGPDMRSWQWGALHQITFEHTLGAQPLLEPLFSPGPFPLRGDNNTVCASGGRMADLKRAQIGGAPFRFTIDMADPDHAQVAFTPGQSGRPGDRHYADGIDDWLAGRYHTLLYQREEIEQAAEARLKLTGMLIPRKSPHTSHSDT